MSAAFTPGPWFVGPSHVVAQRHTDSEGRRVTRFVAEAVLSAPFVEGEREANARLIAAAPELYEALADFEASAALIGNTASEIAPAEIAKRGAEAWARCLNNARFALAKARGQS